MKFILGVVAGAISYWLYQSRGRQRISSAPEFLQHARQSVTSVATAGAQRTVEAIDRAPLPQQVKDVASRATTTVRAESSQRSTSGQPPDSSASSGESPAAGAQTPAVDLPPEAAAP